MHEVIGGISPLQPGWQKILFQPRPGGTIRHAKVSHKSPYGLVSCDWAIQGDKLRVDIRVPPNCTAKIILPGVDDDVGSGLKSYEVDWQEDKEWPPQALRNVFESSKPEDKCIM